MITLEQFASVFYEPVILYVSSNAILINKVTSKHISKCPYKDYEVLRAKQTDTGIIVEVKKNERNQD